MFLVQKKRRQECTVSDGIVSVNARPQYITRAKFSCSEDRAAQSLSPMTPSQSCMHAGPATRGGRWVVGGGPRGCSSRGRSMAPQLSPTRRQVSLKSSVFLILPASSSPNLSSSLPHLPSRSPSRLPFSSVRPSLPD